MRLALALLACAVPAASLGRKPAPAPPPADPPVVLSPFGENLERVRKDVDGAVRSLELLLEEEDLDDDARLRAHQALGSARAARGRARKALAAFEQGERLERRVLEARFFKRVMEAYFGPRGVHGYVIRRDSVYVDGTELDSLEDVERRLPFLKGLYRGRILLTPGPEAALQFDALRREFYQALLEGARLHPGDSRIQGLAGWGRNTDVVYPDMQGLDRLAVIAEEDYQRLAAASGKGK